MTPYPGVFPASEIALCVEHAVHGTGDLKEVEHACWESVGYFLGAGVPAPARGVKTAKGPTDADKLAYAASLKTGGHVTASAAGAPPDWLMALLLQLLQQFLKP